MTRRQFARNTIGALFGVSTIPAALEKPPFRRYIPTAVPFQSSLITQQYLQKVRRALLADTPEGLNRLESCIKEMPARDVPPDITEATKIHLKEMWG